MEERSEQTYEIVRGNRVVITAVVATYNEEQHIGRCLQDLLAQQHVGGEIEIIVVDGTSTDRTIDVVRSFPEYGTKIRLLPNPHRLQVYAWNAALEIAQGEYFAMILAHSQYSPTYFAACLEVMARTRADAVGGVQHPCGEGLIGEAVAWCMSSAAGIGNARYRYTDDEEESDSVFSIFTRTKTLRAAGGYDVRMPFDEDSDMNYRLRKNGAKLVVSPRIGVRYVVRHSFKALAKQMYRYGYWRRVTQLKHAGDVPLRVYVPATLVAALALSAALAVTPLRLVGALVPGVYAAMLLAATICSARRAGSAALIVPAALVTMHLSYGLGYWVALARVRTLPHAARGHTAAR
ncbi:MAG TPA: glycosyltransferase family 2 protein [Candidatus Baltobacteraceae bacterium]|nr:glycosyltransferase family 2 protein [Candidatus Baltobacteraceae bacterium]